MEKIRVVLFVLFASVSLHAQKYAFVADSVMIHNEHSSLNRVYGQLNNMVISPIGLISDDVVFRRFPFYKNNEKEKKNLYLRIPRSYSKLYFRIDNSSNLYWFVGNKMAVAVKESNKKNEDRTEYGRYEDLSLFAQHLISNEFEHIMYQGDIPFAAYQMYDEDKFEIKPNLYAGVKINGRYSIMCFNADSCQVVSLLNKLVIGHRLGKYYREKMDKSKSFYFNENYSSSTTIDNCDNDSCIQINVMVDNHPINTLSVVVLPHDNKFLGVVTDTYFLELKKYNSQNNKLYISSMESQILKSIPLSYLYIRIETANQYLLWVPSPSLNVNDVWNINIQTDIKRINGYAGYADLINVGNKYYSVKNCVIDKKDAMRLVKNFELYIK